jgi:hypothetical protein
MPLCRECGVQIEDDVAACPLCQTPVGARPLRRDSRDEQDHPMAPDAGGGHVRRVVWESFSLVLATAAAVVFAADFTLSRATTWSVIPLLSVGFLWLAGSAVILLGKRVQLILLSVTVSLLLWLALLDRVTTGGPWFLCLALPITVLAAALSSLMVLVARNVDISILSVIALSLVAAGLLLVGVEATLHWFLTNRVFVSWSLLTFTCILPPVLMVFYLQHRLRRSGPEIRKRFHL